MSFSIGVLIRKKAESILIEIIAWLGQAYSIIVTGNKVFCMQTTQHNLSPKTRKKIQWYIQKKRRQHAFSHNIDSIRVLIEPMPNPHENAKPLKQTRDKEEKIVMELFLDNFLKLLFLLYLRKLNSVPKHGPSPNYFSSCKNNVLCIEPI